MLPGVQTIYFDESGFTGNLLHPNLPYFVYAGIAISAEEAEEVVNELIRDYGVQGGVTSCVRVETRM